MSKKSLLVLFACVALSVSCQKAQEKTEAESHAGHDQTATEAVKTEEKTLQAPVITNTKSPAGAKVSILEPADGAEVTSPFKVKFGAENIAVAPAGSDTPDSGHHHLLIDVETLPNAAQPIPADEKHVHFGKGQTETDVTLTAGTHTLQLIMGDKNHMLHDPVVVSEKITVTVK